MVIHRETFIQAEANEEEVRCLKKNGTSLGQDKCKLAQILTYAAVRR